MSKAAPDLDIERRPAVSRKSKALLSIFTLCALAILIGLGVWQLQRRAWKNDIVGRFEQALSRPPVAYEPPLPNANEEAREFTRVTATGAFENDKTAKVLVPSPPLVRAQTQDAFGYLLFTPMNTAKGTVFVNRGFVPQHLADQSGLPAKDAAVTGIVRLSAAPSWFTPAPDLAKRLFFSADIPEMAKAAGISGPGSATSEYIEAEPSPDNAEWPKARDPRELLASIPNRHLGYALTWFGLAAALACVYGIFITRD